MGLSNAERQKKWREIQKLKDKEQFKKQHNRENKKSREKQKKLQRGLPIKELEKMKREKKLKVKERVAKCRQQKKQKLEQLSVDCTPYSNNISLGKALSRAKKNLPRTPRRRKAVLSNLCISEGLNPKQLFSNQSPKSRRSTAVSDETKGIITEFYQQEDISRQAPGRKDVISYRINNIKVKFQTRHLLSSIKETFSLFHEENPESNIGKSKFAELRPKHVLLSSKLPHNVCLCKYHENFINAINSLSKAISFPAYTKELPELLICNSASESCWLNRCDLCRNGKVFLMKSTFEKENLQLSWYVWKQESKEARIQKVKVKGTIEELRLYISSLTPSFLEHCYVKRKQAAAYNKLRKQATSETFNNKKALMQVDFSENYTCISQDEIQAAHWNQSQVSLFTTALWYEGKIHSFVIASDDLRHSKDTVIAYVDRTLDEIPATIESVDIWSDGPASQFKNKYIAAAIHELGKKHNLTIKWHFFATSHGKGPVDGIGGSIKRQVWRQVKKRSNIVNNASNFVEAAAASSNVKVIELNSLAIEEINKDLDLAAVFKSSSPVEGISKMHYIEVVRGKPAAKLLSESSGLGMRADLLDDDSHEIGQSGNRNEDLQNGEWYLVEYNGKLYPGEIKLKVSANEYQVTAMEPAGKNWKWPIHPDEILYTREKLVRKITPPVVINNRGHYMLQY